MQSITHVASVENTSDYVMSDYHLYRVQSTPWLHDSICQLRPEKISPLLMLLLATLEEFHGVYPSIPPSLYPSICLSDWWLSRKQAGHTRIQVASQYRMSW